MHAESPYYSFKRTNVYAHGNIITKSINIPLQWIVSSLFGYYKLNSVIYVQNCPRIMFVLTLLELVSSHTSLNPCSHILKIMFLKSYGRN